MAAPNLALSLSVIGKTAGISLTSTSATTVLSNAASSGKLFRVRSLILANVDGSAAVDVTLSYTLEDNGGGTAYKILHVVTVPAKASLVLQGDPLVNLEEDRSLVATASAANDVDVVVTYDEIG